MRDEIEGVNVCYTIVSFGLLIATGLGDMSLFIVFKRH